jgi:hypothetical protein
VIVSMKYESNNLIATTFTLHLIINCEPLTLIKVFEGTCFGNEMSKAWQYVINDDKVSKGLMQISVKDAQVVLQKTITWTKKSMKGRQEWGKDCIECVMSTWKFETHVKIIFALKVSYNLKRPWNSSTPSSFVMEGKRLSLYNKKFEASSVSYCRGIHMNDHAWTLWSWLVLWINPMFISYNLMVWLLPLP